MPCWRWTNPPNTQFRLNRDSPQARGLVAWWPLNSYRDYARNGILVPSGDPVFSSSQRGTILSLDDASSQYAETSPSPVIAAPIVLSCWFQLGELNRKQVLIYVGNSTVDTNYFVLYVNSSNQLVFGVCGAAGEASITWSETLTANRWYFGLGMKASGDSRYVSLNGKTPTSVANFRAPSGIDRVSIGRFGGATPASYFDGDLSSAEIRNVLLSPVEIWQLYTNPWEKYEPIIPQWINQFVPVVAAGNPWCAYAQQ